MLFVGSDLVQKPNPTETIVKSPQIGSFSKQSYSYFNLSHFHDNTGSYLSACEICHITNLYVIAYVKSIFCYNCEDCKIQDF